MAKPCHCGRKRYRTFKLCSVHYREKLEERKQKRLERKLSSKTYQLFERKKWHRKCWKLMSEWVRRSGADWRGMVVCYTCGKLLPWKESHAGHHFHGKLDFDPRNLRVQDAACNTYRGGMLNVYAKKLIVENGLGWYEQLERDAAQHPGYTLPQLKEIHADLSSKLSRLTPP